MPFPFWQPSLGRQGEYLAIRYLRRKGYYLVARNIHQGKSEIDLVMCNAREVVVVEVKARKPAGEPRRIHELVRHDQKQRLLNAGETYLQSKKWHQQPHRFLLIYILFKSEGSSGKKRTLFPEHQIYLSDL